MRPYFLLALTVLTVIALAPRLALPGHAPAGTFDGIVSIERRYTILGYEREAFGAGWGPAVENPKCTAREQAILDQSQPEAVEGCKAQRGEFYDPYNQATLHLQDGMKLEVDHVFPLSAAWDMGAYGWDTQTRVRFANDPANLVVTIRETNQDKSDQLPSRWMPPHPGSRCWYAQRLAHVARAYELTLTEADLRTMRAACGQAGWLPLGMPAGS